MSVRAVLPAIVVLLCACSTRQPPAPLSWEFGQERYLTSEYLTTSTGASCTKTDGRVLAVGALPDSTYFIVQARPSSFPEPFVTLERGYNPNGQRRIAVGVQLDPAAGIVKGLDRGESQAFGLRSYEARWLSELGTRALALDCPAAR